MPIPSVQTSDGRTITPGYVPTDPTNAHSVTVHKLAEKLSAKGDFDILKVVQADAKAAMALADKGTAAEPTKEAVEAPVAAESAAAEAPITEAPAVTAKPAKPDMSDPKARLARSLAIQRRAEEAQRNVRKAVQKRADAAAKAKATKPAEPTAEDTATTQRDSETARIRAELEANVQLLKTDPLRFARKHGVSGADIAEFVRNDTDPAQRAVEVLRQQAAAAIQQVEQKYDSKIQALQQQLVAQNEATVQRNFFEFVEESKSANPTAFQAFATIYSDEEVWNKANALANRPDLRDSLDEDKLLTELEAEAKKDPRWVKIQHLFEPKRAAATKPNEVAPKTPPNVREQEEAAEVMAPTAPARTTERNDKGQFARSSPLERASMRVNRLASRVGRIVP